MIRASLRNLSAHKARLVATAVAVVLGVAFMAGTLVLSDTVGRSFDNLFADVNSGTDAYVRASRAIQGNHMIADERSPLDASVVETVAAVDGVAAAHGKVEGYAQLVGKSGDVAKTNGGAAALGMAWIEEPRLNPFRISAGRAPAADDEIVIDQRSAKKDDVRVGDTATVLTNAGATTARVVGIATFGTADSPAGAAIVLFSEAAAVRHLSSPGKIDAVSVAADEGVSQHELARRIAQAVPAGVEVLTGAEITDENKSDLEGSIQFFTIFLLVFAGVSLFVGSFIIYNTFSILMAQRSRETALLRALGATRRQVLRAVLLEAAAVGVVASLVGVVLGIGLASGLRSLLDAIGVDLPGGPLVVNPASIAISVALGALVCTASALAPACKASKVPPLAAMRRSEAESWTARPSRAIAGGVLGGLGAVNIITAVLIDKPGGIAWGAFMVGAGVVLSGSGLVRALSRAIGTPIARFHGVAGTMARDNAMRNPKRTGATAAALTIGVALVALIAVVASSTKASVAEAVDRAVTADFVVDSGAMHAGGFSPDLARRVADLPEVDAAVGVRSTLAELFGKGVAVAAAPAASLEEVAELGAVDGDFAATGAGAVAVSEKAAERHGVGVGDTIDAVFAETGTQRLRITAVYENAEVLGDYFVDVGTYEANVSNRLEAKVFATKAATATHDQTRAAIETAAKDYPQATVQDRAEFKAGMAEMVDQIVNLVYALLALAILIALIGIANTLGLSILERTRELGIARAVGMTRSQLKSSVRWEAVIVAVLGTSIGLLLGLVSGYGLVQALESQGVTAFDASVVQLGAIAVIAALAGVGAAVLPARRAARLDVLRAVATT